MFEVLDHLFGAVCGQNLGHTWFPGGLPLPVCQRCTGLYVGALMAAGLHFWSRPHLTGRFLLAHGLFLLVMAPFGFHWVPQGPVLRAVSGALFAFAVVTFLWLPCAGRWRLPEVGKVQRPARYWLGLALTLGLVCFLPEYGSQLTGRVLAFMAAGGMGVMGLLVVANVALAISGSAGLPGWRRPKVPAP